LPTILSWCNFTVLLQGWPELYETAREAEQNFNSAPRRLFLRPALTGTDCEMALNSFDILSF